MKTRSVILRRLTGKDETAKLANLTGEPDVIKIDGLTYIFRGFGASSRPVYAEVNVQEFTSI